MWNLIRHIYPFHLQRIHITLIPCAAIVTFHNKVTQENIVGKVFISNLPCMCLRHSGKFFSSLIQVSHNEAHLNLFEPRHEKTNNVVSEQV